MQTERLQQIKQSYLVRQGTEHDFRRKMLLSLLLQCTKHSRSSYVSANKIGVRQFLRVVTCFRDLICIRRISIVSQELYWESERDEYCNIPWNERCLTLNSSQILKLQTTPTKIHRETNNNFHYDTENRKRRQNICSFTKIRRFRERNIA